MVDCTSKGVHVDKINPSGQACVIADDIADIVSTSDENISAISNSSTWLTMEVNKQEA